MSNSTEFTNNETESTVTELGSEQSAHEADSYAWTRDRPVSEQVVQAVATAAERSVTEIEPLNDAVDADALNNLFSPKFDGSVRRGGYLAFEYASYFVTVFASGRIEVADST